MLLIAILIGLLCQSFFVFLFVLLVLSFFNSEDAEQEKE